MRTIRYVLTDETITIDEHVLHRIACVKPFDEVKAGEL